MRTGTEKSTLDEKGRVVIPASMRDRYTGKLVITQGKEECVWIMTPERYQKYKERFKKKLDRNEISGDEYEAFQYQLESAAETREIDFKTGRIAIPAFLRSYAHISKDCKDCLVISIRNHLEVWNADQHKNFMNEVRQINKNTHKKLLGKVDFFSDEDDDE